MASRVESTIYFLMHFVCSFVLFCFFKHSMKMKNKWNSNVFCVELLKKQLKGEK